jgi:PAS domain S-box-containing protein
MTDPAENRFKMLVQSITDYAIYQLDPQGIISSWNAGAQRFKGYHADEIIGHHFSRFYTEEDRATNLPMRALRVAEQEGRFEAEGWRCRKDGSRFWANVVIDPIRDPSGRLVGFAKITRDLTEKHAADEALRLSEERFRLLVESVTDYAIYMLDPDGVVSSWNTGAQHAKGYLADEILGQHFSRFYTEEDRAADLPRRALRTAEQQGGFEAEGWRCRKDGTRFWANVVIRPMRDNSGKLLGFSKVTRDLTERQEAQKALEKAQNAFFQSQKMDAIGQLTGGVAHDFNNLLSAVIGSLELAKKRLVEGGDAFRFIENARQAAERGAILTQRMLAFARKQELSLIDVNVVELVHGMTELMQRTIGAGVTIETCFPPVLESVRADSIQLELAILNLAVNSRDAMPDGGKILISGSLERIVGEHRSHLPDGTYVRLSVSDTGQGMDAETLARATEPFYTTKGIGKGTGLGLSMVHGLVKQCDGGLELESQVGQGTTVTVWLPVAQPGAIHAKVPARKDPSLDSGKPFLILAVDDDELVLTNTVAMLEDLGHQVLEASSGQEALKLLAAQPIGMLITDYAMPDMNGLELIRTAQMEQPNLPVILISGYADLTREDVIPFLKLSKPLRQAELSRAITQAIVQRP